MTDSGLPTHPIPDSYWVCSGRLLAGEYPGAREEDEARQKLCRLLAVGVSFFLDLTEAEEHLKPYASLLQEEAAARGLQVEHCRMPIRDQDTPSVEYMARILDAIDGALDKGHILYVHCYGGIGRTGTVVGCYLARHGMDGRQAIDEIARLRQDTPDRWRESPETNSQREMVWAWKTGQ